MKASILKFTTVIVFALGLAANTSAQGYTHLKVHELPSIQEIRLDVDVRVLLIKSSKNQITLVGDSAFVHNPPMKKEDGILALSHNIENGPELNKIVIEYKDINRVVTGGAGDYYFHKMDAQNLKLYNKSATVKLNGKTEDISIYSEKGDIDITEFKAKRMITRLGEAAVLKTPKEVYTYNQSF